MISLSIALIVSVFVAGLLTFLAPCTLPLVPAYVAFISGVKRDETLLRSSEKNMIRVNGTMFVVGFSLVFILFGVLAGYFGSFVGPYRGLLSQAGGVLVIIFGLIMLGIIRVEPLARNHNIHIPGFLKPGNPMSALLIGMAFAFGWTPCIGPILSSVFLLATTTSTIMQGTALLFVFSLGLALPFLSVAFMYAEATRLIEKYRRYTLYIPISSISGILLIILGILLLSGQFGLTTEYGYRLYYFLGFDALFNYF